MVAVSRPWCLLLCRKAWSRFGLAWRPNMQKAMEVMTELLEKGGDLMRRNDNKQRVVDILKQASGTGRVARYEMHDVSAAFRPRLRPGVGLSAGVHVRVPGTAASRCDACPRRRRHAQKEKHFHSTFKRIVRLLVQEEINERLHRDRHVEKSVKQALKTKQTRLLNFR